MSVPKSHPRYTSLKIRDKIVAGVELGITSLHGLTAHGRGEAFDYLLGEKTNDFAKEAITQAVTMLVTATHPVISVNGNSAALVGKELLTLSKLLNAPLEINIFHASKKREEAMKKYLEKLGAKHVLMPSKKHTIKYLDSNRKFINPKGIAIADVVFVPLEDGDRTQALIKNGKKVVTIDLNPLSRTAQAATITIVDNIVRALPLLIDEIKKQDVIARNVMTKQSLPRRYDNKEILQRAIDKIKGL